MPIVSAEVVLAKSSTDGCDTVMPAKVCVSVVANCSVPPLKATPAFALTLLLWPRARVALVLIAIPEVPIIAPCEPDVVSTPAFTVVVPE